MTDRLPRIPVAAPVLDGREREYVNECLETTWISSAGRFIGEFERAFADYCGVKHAVACNNGTTALHVALVALGIGPGDEVIVPSLTYIASANAVSYCGATPVFAENETRTFNIDPADIEALITPKTRAIMPVHLYGHPADMDPINAIAKKHGLFVVEDAAEAVGGQYKGRTTGSLGMSASLASSATRSSPPARAGWSPPTMTRSPSACGSTRARGWTPIAATGSRSSATTTA
jgi:perosamine synthetase